MTRCRLPLLVMLLVLGCAQGQRARPAAAASTAVPTQSADPWSVWMDCRVDGDCRLEGTVCHAQVLGGTCAPPCQEDAVCQGVDESLACASGRCVSRR